MPELEPGTNFAGHRIESVAGRGGMGVVYRATHLALDHVVAMKVISPQLADDDVFRRRFERESRAAVSIRHPHVVPIHHAGEEDGLLFVTMDLIEGSDLRRVLRAAGRLSPERAVVLAEHVSSALDAAHERGLVHRDVKPGNVLIEPRRDSEHGYLTDFGLTKPIEGASDVTQSGAFVGTLDYVAPEQIRGDRLDARTDVYALGCVLFEMLSGRAPFADRAEKVAKLYGHLEDDPPRVETHAPDVPPALGQVIRRALSKPAEERFPSAGDVARAARAVIEGDDRPTVEHSVATGLAAPTREEEVAEPAAESTVESPLARPESARRPERPPERRTERSRRSGRVLLALLGLAAAVAILWLVLRSGDDERPGGEASDAGAALVGSPIAVTGDVVGAAAGAGSVWVSTRAAGTVDRLDPGSGEVVSRIPVGRASGGSAPEQATFGAGALWVALGSEDSVARVSPGSGPGNESVATFPVGDYPRGVAVGAGSVWVTNGDANTVTRLDPETGAQVETIDVGAFPREATVAAGSVWIANRDSDSVSSIDPDDGSVQAIEVRGEPKSMAFAGGLLWVTERAAGSVAGIDPDQARVVARIDDVGDRPQGALAAFGSLWIANTGGSVTRIDAGEPAVVETIETGPKPEEIAAAGGLLWVTLGDADRVARIEP